MQKKKSLDNFFPFGKMELAILELARVCDAFESFRTSDLPEPSWPNILCLFVALFVLSLCHNRIPFAVFHRVFTRLTPHFCCVGAFVIGLSQISSFFSLIMAIVTSLAWSSAFQVYGKFPKKVTLKCRKSDKPIIDKLLFHSVDTASQV